MKRYHNDPAKSKARQLQKELLERTVLKYKQPSDLRVLCFPGIDGMEVIEVTDRLGIPRKNIVGLEMEPEIADNIERIMPDIDLQRMSLKDYVNGRKQLFIDYVSLDFTQNLSADTIDTAVETGFAIKLNSYLIHVAVQRQREHKVSQEYMKMLSFSSKVGKQLSAKGSSFMDEYGAPEIDGLREDSLFVATIGQGGACRSSSLPKMYDYLLGDQSKTIIENCVEAFVENFEDDEDRNNVRDALKHPASSDGLRVYKALDQILLAAAKHRIYLSIGDQLTIHFASMEKVSQAKRITDMAAPFILAAMMTRFKGTAYVINDGAKYAYISESGTPMMGNVAFMHNDRKAMKHFDDLLDTIDVKTLRIKDVLAFTKQVYRIPEFFDSRGGLSFSNFHETSRTYLGSSAKPILRKAKAIELLSSGKALDEILALYRGMSRRSLGAIKAHVTMGTYAGLHDAHDDSSRMELRQDIDSRISLGEIGVSIEDGRLDKADILEYLRAGVPPSEIKEAYPATSLARIRALDHWRKRKEQAA